MEEAALKNKFRFEDIFNDTSLHLFPGTKLQSAPDGMWLNQTEPAYESSDVEIIQLGPKPVSQLSLFYTRRQPAGSARVWSQSPMTFKIKRHAPPEVKDSCAKFPKAKAPPNFAFCPISRHQVAKIRDVTQNNFEARVCRSVREIVNAEASFVPITRPSS